MSTKDRQVVQTNEEIGVAIPTAEKTEKICWSRTCRTFKNIVVHGNDRTVPSPSCSRDYWLLDCDLPALAVRILLTALSASVWTTLFLSVSFHSGASFLHAAKAWSDVSLRVTCSSKLPGI